MPEYKGVVTDFIKKKDGTTFGLKLGREEFLYSFPNKRGEPWEADDVRVGDMVRIEWAPYGEDKQYASVIERLALHPDAADPTDGDHALVGQWGFEQKDKLGLMQTCLNVEGNNWAAALNSGAVPKVPESTTVADGARAMFREVLKDID